MGVCKLRAQKRNTEKTKIVAQEAALTPGTTKQKGKGYRWQNLTE